MIITSTYVGLSTVTSLQALSSFKALRDALQCQILRSSISLTFTSDKHHFFIPLFLPCGICKYDSRSSINRGKSVDKYGTVLIAISRIAGLTFLFSQSWQPRPLDPC